MKSILVLVVAVVGYTTAQFVENCPSPATGTAASGSCDYQNGVASFYQRPIACSDGTCACKADSGYIVADAPSYKFQWKNGQCVIAGGGPCGPSKDNQALEFKCDAGFQCIQSRCRDPSKKAKQGHSCDDDIDCEDGLKCTPPSRPFDSKRCQNPQ